MLLGRYLSINDLNRDKCRRRQILLPATQNPAVDAVTARHFRDARARLLRRFQDPAFVCLIEASPMTLARSRNDGAGGGISPVTNGVTKDVT